VLSTPSPTNNLNIASCAEGFYITEIVGKKGLLLETMSFKCNDGTTFGQFGTGTAGTDFSSGVFLSGFSQFTVLYRDPFLNNAPRVFDFVACDDGSVCYTIPDSCDGAGCVTTAQESFTCQAGSNLIGFSAKYAPFSYDSYNGQPGPYIVQYMLIMIPLCRIILTDSPKLPTV